MGDWSVATYLQFDTERTRAAADLLARVPLTEARRIVDVGCGPGNSTELLARRFPTARVEGFDTSSAMLDAARQRLPDACFFDADVLQWQPAGTEDLIFANAVLQWVPHHLAVVRRLVEALPPKSVLAFQVPDNFEEPSHRLMRDVAEAGPWRTKLAAADTARETIASPCTYFETLAGLTSGVDIWRTVYHHVLENAEAVVRWLEGTGLRPFLEPLTSDERAEFLQRFGAAVAEAYPPQSDGRVLFPFPRLFVIAIRG